MYTMPTFVTEVLCLLLVHDCFKWLLKYINNLHNAILLLLGWFLWGT